MIRFLRRFDPRSIRLLIFDLDGTLIDSRLDLVHSVNATLRHFARPELNGAVIASYVGDGAPTLVRRALIADGEALDPAVSAESALASTTTDPADHEAFFRSALDYFLGYYRLHKLDHTTVYDGIPETLAALANGVAHIPAAPSAPSGHAEIAPAAGPGSPSVQAAARHDARPARLMAVLSNKPVRPSQDIVKALGLADFFVRIYGGNSFATKKPDPLGARTLLEETGVPAGQALIIGDSSVDVLTARNAGIWSCGVNYGFAPHSLEEVPPDVAVDAPRELGELLLRFSV